MLLNLLELLSFCNILSWACDSLFYRIIFSLSRRAMEVRCFSHLRRLFDSVGSQIRKKLMRMYVHLFLELRGLLIQ